ncbi:type I-F CRISPR-associated helicase Cas3f [Gynuella sunshinyii]|uniref:Putative helicase n=1 Tax=Gynuella sunshinyii YC6258 TaxID=1445510 RepID=A0A0C5VS40_9GAMM|nr:type I-F CRISPR-associated helicase Cas3f [Gynuella sunshinyii]AJQ97041.1 putative helicase [Gynuella sunshinyii YC6258]
MMVTFISQCEKKSLIRTRRVLDAFADRIGDNTWQTVITHEGLLAVKKLLRKSASKNTAVSCHWIRSRSRSELVWVVGRRDKFDLSGRVPVNRTVNTSIKTEMDVSWNTAYVITLLSAIAGLFHDLGKASLLFQDKLQGNNKLGFEPYRHEWVSLRIFEALVKSSGITDQEWLNKLHSIKPSDEKNILAQLQKDDFLAEQKDPKLRKKSPFPGLPPVAEAVAWLIVSHHRLPKHIPSKMSGDRVPPVEYAEYWLDKCFRWDWNSRNAESDKVKTLHIKQNWQFPGGTPIRSHRWCQKAHELAKRALTHDQLLAGGTKWLQDRFTCHMARLVLMLSDHVYSASAVTEKWQDTEYLCYANTDRLAGGKLKQKLDEHNIGVACNANFFAKELSSLKRSLPSLALVKGLEKNTAKDRFRWQNSAVGLAKTIKEDAGEHGFFGVNMASTGCGKTLANMKIMYALADQKIGCRVSIALGLRTLTQQTGDALMSLLGLGDDDIATMIGSQAIRQLHEYYENSQWESSGSASAESLVDSNQVIRYAGEMYDSRLKQWLENSPRLQQLLSAPVLVSTIDHIMPATEGERGGKQIAPMLRLLTSDLILDEPDDFDKADIPALCRLVNWAGMLGARVLISSATLMPVEVSGLFEAYREGRLYYNRACGEPRSDHVCCAWFDETIDPVAATLETLSGFEVAHEKFVTGRCQELAKQPVKRRAQLLPVDVSGSRPKEVISAVAATVNRGIYTLHQRYHLTQPQTDKRISIGLVRMANINPLVAVATELLSQPASANYRLHFCIYHSRHPLIVRSSMERALDAVLKRNDESAIWQQPEIAEALSAYPEQHHIFVVFATAVAEVGRDHDYDWAIVEPSSMRSIIQLAGRVWRHRDKICQEPNILILNQNYRALTGHSLAYTQPGFETPFFKLTDKDLQPLQQTGVLDCITAIPRIQTPEELNASSNLIHLEHACLRAVIHGYEDKITYSAACWWQQPVSWSAELQRNTRFRQSRADDRLFLKLEDELDEPDIYIDFGKGQEPKPVAVVPDNTDSYPPGVCPWLNLSVVDLLADIVETSNMGWQDASNKFTEMRVVGVDQAGERSLVYSPVFGIYRPLF